MLAFYRNDGPFVAAAIQEPQDGVTILGDFQFLMEKTNGSSSWRYFVQTLAGFDDGAVRVVYLPDSDECPQTLDAALELAQAAGFIQVPTQSSEPDAPTYEPPYVVFSGFEAVGPLLLEFFADEFETWMRTSDQMHRWEEFTQDIRRLREINDELKTDEGEGASDLEMWDGDWLYGLDQVSTSFEDRYMGTRPPGSKLLVMLGEGDWVELLGATGENGNVPISVKFHHLDSTNPAAAANLVASWIESQSAGYVAAIHLIFDPMFYNSDGDDEIADAFRYIGEDCICQIDAFSRGDENLTEALVRASPQFAEFKEIVEGPRDERFELFLELAESEHVGFGGRMGLFAEWSTK
jgi:hypothetical protein